MPSSSIHVPAAAALNAAVPCHRGPGPAACRTDNNICSCNELPCKPPRLEPTLLNEHGMPSREFEDTAGIAWRVWNTVPISGAVITPGFEKGWLTFESEMGTLRRLAPVPSGWEDLTAERLELLLRNATQVPRHTGPMRRVPRPDSTDSR